MDNLQALINGLSADWQRERAGTQMTLGDLIKKLRDIPADTKITGLGELDSYRGYYCDLAFAPTSETRTAEHVLDACRSAMGKVFTGYKGGDYVMGELTPVWVADYGCTGMKLMDINTVEDQLELGEDE